MRNERKAGRKPVMGAAQVEEAAARHQAGESIASLAREYGISRQALTKRLARRQEDREVEIVCLKNGTCVTKIHANPYRQVLRIENYADRISERVFGADSSPGWQDLMEMLSMQYQQGAVPGGFGMDGTVFPPQTEYVCLDYPGQRFSIHSIRDGAGYAFVCEKDLEYTFQRKDLIALRTDTDGYQIKALTPDRRTFVKAQAVIAGVAMDDWAVEIIASDLCRQLSIPCVQQTACTVLYGGRRYKAVRSDNFELDGDTFLSFERMLERRGLSSRDQDFIQLDAPRKLIWCAEQLSLASRLPREDTFKYMLDLAVLDCLTGNVDRHTRNFGLFYTVVEGEYRIPLIFDNGMGLFEHDPYRDRYQSYEEAMHNVYIEPYGEDPFELMDWLDKEFDLVSRYPGLRTLHYPDILSKPFAVEYERRMVRRWQK